MIFGRPEWSHGDLGTLGADICEGGGGEFSEGDGHRLVWRKRDGGGQRTRAVQNWPWAMVSPSCQLEQRDMSRINHAPIVRSPDLEIHTSSPSHGQHSIHIGHPTPCPRFSQRVQSSPAHHLQPSTLKSQSLRRNPKSLSFCRLSENRPYDAIRSSAHRMSHPGLNHKNPQKQPLKKLPGLLVRRKSSRSVLRQSYDARPPLIPLNQVVPLSSERSSILLNFQKPTALLSVTHLFRILLIQRLRMVISAIKNPLHQNHSENRSQNQDR